MGRATVLLMAERKLLTPSQAKEVEEHLFSTLRQQAGRSVPIPLPRVDFWDNVGLLLDTIEMEIHDVYRSVGPSLKLQTLQKRQANIRRTASELARKRIVAMVQHSASIALRAEGGLQGQDLPNLDWSRHDPSEREFYANASEQLNKFKHSVNWNGMQIGLAIEEITQTLTAASGTTQLDSYAKQDGGLTGSGPPLIALEDDNEPLPEREIDEEEILAKTDEFPELGASLTNVEQIAKDIQHVGSHAAAMELAPSKKKVEMDFDAWAEAEIANNGNEQDALDMEVEDDLLRIRILKTIEEPVVTSEGEIELSAGDVLFLDRMTSDYLVEAGFAEVANL